MTKIMIKLTVLLLLAAVLPILVRAYEDVKLVGSRSESGASPGGSSQGWSVSLSADGKTALWGGYRDSEKVLRGGAAWVFVEKNGVWTEQAKLFGTGSILTNPRNVNNAGIYQGACVALDPSGNTAIVGGFGDNDFVGAVWVFSRKQGAWSQEAKLLDPNTPLGFQGWSCDIRANTIVTGGYAANGNNGAAWTFQKKGQEWVQLGERLDPPESSQKFGGSVSLSADALTLVVGAYADQKDLGCALVYTRSSHTDSVWNQDGPKLVGEDSEAPARQGWNLAMSNDGNTFVMGANKENGSRGGAYLFVRVNGVWKEQAHLQANDATDSAEQGTSVAISADGNTVAVGGYLDGDGVGASWIYTRTNQVWTQKGSKLVAKGYLGTKRISAQGASTALSASGNILLVGANLDDTRRGACFVFDFRK
jgi:hypothetical protein